MEMINAAEEMAAGSQAGSVGRRLEDVQSEPGSSGPLTTVLPPTTENLFEGIFSESTTPTIYDIFSEQRGVSIFGRCCYSNTWDFGVIWVPPAIW